MSQWKGPREQVMLKMPPETKAELTRRARLAGMTYSEYVVALLARDQLDEEGRPAWAPTPVDEQALPLAV